MAPATTRYHSGAPPLLKAKARNSTRKPTEARIKAMADAARRIPALRSSAFSIASGGVAATTTLGRRRAKMAPTANTIPARPTDHCAPPSLSRTRPGPPAATAAMPLSRLSFELASTSSSSLCTVVGTKAAREIRYALANTNMRNASR